MADLVVVGASLAGLRAVEAVRSDGFDGSVTLVGAEEHLPYDRPPLSKDHLADDEPRDSTYREREKLDEIGVELLLGAPATALDVDPNDSERSFRVELKAMPGQEGEYIATIPFNRVGRFALCDPPAAGLTGLKRPFRQNLILLT